MMIDNFNNEQWRDIDGYDGMYQVSDLGRVRSKYSGEWKVLSAKKDKDGYLQVSLCKDGKQKTAYIHRLVAHAFIPNTDSSKTIINHRNSIRDCNRVENLEWCTIQYNVTYNDIHHRRNTKRCKIKSLYRPNLSIPKNLEIFKSNGIECSYSTVRRLRKDLGISKKYTKRS